MRFHFLLSGIVDKSKPGFALKVFKINFLQVYGFGRRRQRGCKPMMAASQYQQTK
jgi:hypothetical protein